DKKEKSTDYDRVEKGEKFLERIYIQPEPRHHRNPKLITTPSNTKQPSQHVLAFALEVTGKLIIPPRWVGSSSTATNSHLASARPRNLLFL
ncbi:hypothetical protein K0M31_006921, partial [Melipona bicolor]